MIHRMQDDTYRVIGFLWLCYIMIIIPLTMLMLSKWVGFNAKKEFHLYLEAPITTDLRESKDYFYIFSILMLFSIAAIIYMITQLNNVPIIAALTGSSDLGRLRIEASHGFTGNVLFKNIFALGLTPILSLIAYVYYVKTKLLRWKISFMLMFVLSVFVSVYDLQKAPVFFYILMFILINFYIGKIRLSLKRLMMLGSVGVILIVTMYVFIQGVTSVDQFLSYNSGPVGRLILSQISPFFLHLELFGNQVDFLNGRSLPNILLQFYDLEQVRSAKLVMGQYFPDRVAEGTAGVLNTVFAGEAYANFGYLGILFGTIYLGAYIQIMYIFFIRMPKNPVFISLFVFFTVNIPRVVVGGFMDFIFNPFWLFVFILFLSTLFCLKIKQEFLRIYIKQAH
ncbi:O-antigen polymerase [Sutcliffiella horikoshii]|uniref:O-antigen polymerase n=1 Tax=Sutcliffiella horikoshii TaxID=79883 RepID=UPI001F20F15A|nr:O-antigen polymerase [Sutcliffiella horikoshii]